MNQIQTFCSKRWWSVFRVLPRMTFLLKLPGQLACFMRTPDIPASTVTPEARDAALQRVYEQLCDVSPPDVPVETAVPAAPVAPEAAPRLHQANQEELTCSAAIDRILQKGSLRLIGDQI